MTTTRIARHALVAWAAAAAAQALPSEVGGPLSQGEHQARLNGATIAYHVHGAGAVLIAHPGGPGAEWRYLRMPGVERMFTVVYLEPIGTGGSGRLDKPSDYRMARYVEDVEALRAHLGVHRFYLLGHSHGGFVAQAYALAHPDHLSGLILYDTSPTTGADWQADVEANTKWFSEEPWFQDATAALALETSAKTDDDMTAIFKREEPLYFADWTTHGSAYQAELGDIRFFVGPTKATDPSAAPGAGVAPPFEVRDELLRIKVPTLVIVGRKDFVCSLKMAQAIAHGISGSEIVVLEHSGHMGHIEEPDAFAQAISDFLDSIKR